MSVTETRYALAREVYAGIGVDTEAALAALDRVPLSLPCPQDGCADVPYPGRALSPEELRADMELALSLIPGPAKVGLHALRPEDGDRRADRDELEPAHFASWAQWACGRALGLDFHPAYFSHPLCRDGLTLSHPDDGVRRFWIEHGKRCRRIAEALARATGIRCVCNLRIPDCSDERPVDTAGPRVRLLHALDEIYAEPSDPARVADALESGAGRAPYAVCSPELCLGYAATHRGVLLTLGAGRFPAESAPSELTACLLYCDALALRVGRSAASDGELRALTQELVRADALGRVHLALDGFGPLAERVLSARNVKKTLLRALLEPVGRLRALEEDGDHAACLALAGEAEGYPSGAVWDRYCEIRGVPVRDGWLSGVRAYEEKTAEERS